VPGSITSLLKINPREMSVRPRDSSADWLHQALQCAVELELSTIPPYLCARWSIKDLNSTNYVVRSLAYVVGQEMKHLGQACNLMTAYGWTPRLNHRSAVPRYPCPMPGGVHPGLCLGLCPLSKDLIGTVFMQIEFPSPNALSTYGEKYYPTIGAFYEAIAEVVRQRTVPMVGGPQLDGEEGIDLIKVTNPTDAIQAIDMIRREGEGGQGTPFTPDGTPAHYYRFAEMFWERKIALCGDGGWGFCGARIDFPPPTAIYPMAPVPKRGYPTVPQAQAFNRKYTHVLDLLQAAWGSATGGQQLLHEAITIMREKGPGSMSGLARLLMDTPKPDGVGNYGPDFRYLGGCLSFLPFFH
jgi:hypothetical protein